MKWQPMGKAGNCIASRGIYPEFGKEMDAVFIVLLFAIAFFYSSVGHGGASGYLALMTLFGISTTYMKSTSLTLNVFVSAIAFVSFARAGYFRYKIVVPFIIGSIPMSFIGAWLPVKPNIYESILGVLLLFAIIRMLFIPGAIAKKSTKPPFMPALLIGGVLGLFSGMIGIGGGIILSPLLILFGWATLKESAAASALFILLNSLSGLTALIIQGLHYEANMVLWIVSGIMGGVAGSWFGSVKIPANGLKYILAGILLLASIKLFIF